VLAQIRSTPPSAIKNVPWGQVKLALRITCPLIRSPESEFHYFSKGSILIYFAGFLAGAYEKVIFRGFITDGPLFLCICEGDNEG